MSRQHCPMIFGMRLLATRYHWALQLELIDCCIWSCEETQTQADTFREQMHAAVPAHTLKNHQEPFRLLPLQKLHQDGTSSVSRCRGSSVVCAADCRAPLHLWLLELPAHREQWVPQGVRFQGGAGGPVPQPHLGRVCGRPAVVRLCASQGMNCLLSSSHRKHEEVSEWCSNLKHPTLAGLDI